MAQDLRTFLDLVKRSRPEDVQIISRPVDPAYEITALVVHDLRQRAEIDVLATAHDFLHRAGGHDPRRDRALHGAQVSR